MSDVLTELAFGMDTNTYPLDKKIVLREGIAGFDSQIQSIPTSSADCVFLSSISWVNCAYGACACQIYPFICTPEQPFKYVPTAAEVLSELHATNFQSEHISNFDTTQIPYLGYQPYTKNDEIHTDPDKQYIFTHEVPDEDEGDGEDVDEFETSRDSHKVLRGYVLNQHLYYVLIHDKPQEYDGYMYSNFVLLFALGVSSATGNLVGVVSNQVCHNLCD